AGRASPGGALRRPPDALLRLLRRVPVHHAARMDARPVRAPASPIEYLAEARSLACSNVLGILRVCSEEAALTNVGRVLEARGSEIIGEAYKDPVTSFRDFHKFSNENPEAYWKMVFEEMGITFSVAPSCILRDSDAYPGGEWLPGAVLNAAANCLTAKPGRTSSDVAIVWRDEGKDSEPLNFVTVEELRKKVCLVANALDALNLAKGSAIAIDMPMNVNAVVIYLAIVLAGYIVVSIADSFAAPAISTRLKISEAKAIFTQDCILRDDKELPLYRCVIQVQRALILNSQSEYISHTSVFVLQ
uniref:AMP-dependent synthetase/ligase domain-containing protein n=1 Tax=Aegilops tauschii subsp. strangulata TaxID=200361 RepID=A0A453KQX0_AEGTS